MSNYNTTNYFTTLGDYINAYVDLGTVFVDLSFNQTIYSTKTYVTAPMTNYPSTGYQLINKQYVDDNFNTINYKLSMPNTNSLKLVPTGGTLSIGSLIINTLNVNVKRSVTPFQNFTTLQKKSISNQIDAPANIDTLYTFGVSKPSMWLAGGASQANGNSLAFSYDGINWSGIASTDISGVRALAYNGSIFVAGCCVYTPDTANFNGGYGARTSLAYSYNGINWIPNFYAQNIIPGGVNGLAWNGRIFVAACQLNSSGLGNTIAYSYDGIQWIGAFTPNIFTTFGANAVAWNGFLWVATGGGGTNITAYSYNGINWTLNGITNQPNVMGNCIATDGVRWMVGGISNPCLSYSYNGAAWISLGQPAGMTSIFGIAHNGYMWVAVGSGTNSITFSYDGINWTNPSNSTSVFSVASWGRCVAWNGYMWVAGGGTTLSAQSNTLAYSYNGMYWYLVNNFPFSMACNAVIWTGRRENIIYYPQNRVLHLGLGTNYQIGYLQPNLFSATPSSTAPDFNALSYNAGLNWCETTFNTGSTFSAGAYGAAWNGFKWIAVGSCTNSSYGFGNTMAYSTIIGNTIIGNAGNVWIGMQNRIFLYSGTNIGWNGNIWIATGIGGNSIAWSSDGNSWFGLGTTIFSNFGQTIAWNGQYWLAGGNGAGNTMAFSYDGIQWLGLGNTIFNIQCNGLAWNGAIWVAVGMGSVNTMAYSQDGFNWVGLGKNSFTVSGNDVAVNISAGVWVATGYYGNNAVMSSDGILWRTTTFGPSTAFSATWCGKYWVGCGGGIMNGTSSDGFNWVGYSNTMFNVAGTRAVWNQGLGTTIIKNNYLAKSNLNTTTNLIVFFGYNSTLYYSTNGINWQSKVQLFNYDQIRSIAYNGTIWVGAVNIAGGPGTSPSCFIYSYDGINWVNSNTKIVDSVAQVSTNNVMFVAGSITNNVQYYSYDGINWSIGYNNSLTTPLNIMIWNSNNHFWIGMGGTGAWSNLSNTTSGVAYSADGVGWFNMPNCNLFNFVCSNMAWNGTQFIAVGAPVLNSGRSIWNSYDGQRWIASGLSNPIFNVLLATSSGDPFTNTSSGFSSTYKNVGRSIAYNGTLWLACGTGLVYGNNTSIIYSYDGMIWYNQPNGDIFGATGTAYNIFWTGAIWICNGASSAGNSQVVYSYDGFIWFISTYNNSGTIVLNSTYTSAIQSNIMYNINKVQLNLNGPLQSKTLDIVAENYNNGGYNKIMFNA